MRWRKFGMALCLTLGMMPCADAQYAPLPTEAPPDTQTSPPPESTPSAPPTQLAPSPPQDVVRLPLDAHITVQIPRGWYACNDDTNKLLGGVKLPPELASQMCGEINKVSPTFGVINPNLTQLMFGLVFQMKNPVVTSNAFERLPPEELQSHIDRMCATARGSQKFAASDCVLALSTLGGRAVLVGRMTGTSPDSKMTMHMRLAAIPEQGSVLLLMIADINGDQAVTEPVLDAIFASVAID
jgi:hypothetical protein